ncbi:MAG: hypothetical protein GY755_10055 [Chloroflexi bacterium]|nr:hypothetical protein [Chloroflexota bacterium]
MFNFIKNKFSKNAIKGMYILAFTPEEMTEETLQTVIPIAEKMLKEKSATFAALLDAMEEDTPVLTSNRLYNPALHNPHTMQVTFDTWLSGQYEAKFEPRFDENFFPHAMSDPQGRENFFLYYFDVEEKAPPKKFSLVDMFE